MSPAKARRVQAEAFHDAWAHVVDEDVTTADIGFEPSDGALVAQVEREAALVVVHRVEAVTGVGGEQSTPIAGVVAALRPLELDHVGAEVGKDLACERGSSNPAFLRLLWMPPGLMTDSMPITDERQKSFVTELQKRITAGAELLQTSVEDLKTRIVEKLNPPAKTTERDDRHSKLKQVYLICENQDRGLIRPIKQYLFQQDLEVITWLDGGGTDTLMDYHRKNLKECDAALVYFGSGDEPWVRKNLEDLEKAYGYGHEADWLANAVYVGAPANEQKEDFLTHLVPYVIRNFSSFDSNDLRDFVSAVKSAAGGLQ